MKNSNTASFHLDLYMTRLVFSENNTLNAKLLAGGRVRYIVSTTDRHAQHTKIIDAITRTEVASIRKRTLYADRITLAYRQGGATQKLADVLQQYKMGGGCPGYRIHTEKGDFYWRIHPVYRLALYSASNSAYPVAYRESISHPITTFALVVQKEFEDMIDYIIPTFLVLEQQLRMGERQAKVTEGTSTLNSTIFGIPISKENLYTARASVRDSCVAMKSHVLQPPSHNN